jgi:hypothetical protein
MGRHRALAGPGLVMRYGGRRGTTLAQVEKRQTSRCPVCHTDFASGVPTIWTSTRERIHERCLSLWMLSSRSHSFGAWVSKAIHVVLAPHDGRLCVACLALMLSLSLEDAQRLATAAVALPGLAILPAACGACGRDVGALCAVPSTTVEPPRRRRRRTHAAAHDRGRRHAA